MIDTLLFLSPWKVSEVIVRGQTKNDLLYHVMIQLVSNTGQIATGIMNRDSGATEEKLEVFTPGGKWLVENVADSYLFQDKSITKVGQDDWTPTLRKRGFEQIVNHFHKQVTSGNVTTPDLIALETHRICEDVVQQLEQL